MAEATARLDGIRTNLRNRFRQYQQAVSSSLSDYHAMVNSDAPQEIARGTLGKYQSTGPPDDPLKLLYLVYLQGIDLKEVFEDPLSENGNDHLELIRDRQFQEFCKVLLRVDRERRATIIQSLTTVITSTLLAKRGAAKSK